MTQRYYNFGIPIKVCHFMTIFNNKNGSFTFIYLYFIKILVFPLNCVAYVDVILQVCYSRRLQTAGTL